MPTDKNLRCTAQKHLCRSVFICGRIFVDISELAQVLTALGCPAEKSAEMAAQLDKRARQLAEQKSRSYEEALQHLLTLMRNGWAAKEKGL
jgi:hypothetical protein